MFMIYRFLTRSKFFRTGLVFASAVSLNACAGGHSGFSGGNGREHFSESIYGKASPHARSGAAYYTQLQKPYQIKGRWYYPQNPKKYKKVGFASWYGSAFQGRLTADGEVYDMARLTAAHPTLPLPCYARVTNLQNGSSVIVRVNDRGPYVANRLIDLSKRAAELLQYKDNGLAKVKVEYVGRAPLSTNDTKFLLASYRPAGVSTDFFGRTTQVAQSEVLPKKGSYRSTNEHGHGRSHGHKRAIPVPTSRHSLLTARADDETGNLPALPKVGPLLALKPN